MIFTFLHGITAETMPVISDNVIWQWGTLLNVDLIGIKGRWPGYKRQMGHTLTFLVASCDHIRLLDDVAVVMKGFVPVYAQSIRIVDDNRNVEGYVWLPEPDPTLHTLTLTANEAGRTFFGGSKHVQLDTKLRNAHARRLAAA